MRRKKVIHQKYEEWYFFYSHKNLNLPPNLYAPKILQNYSQKYLFTPKNRLIGTPPPHPTKNRSDTLKYFVYPQKY